MTKLQMRHVFTQVFLTLAYIMVTLQWLWILAIGLPQLIETGVFDSFLSAAPTEPTSTTSAAEFSPIVAIVAGIVTLLFLALTIIIFIKLPKAISNTGETIVHQSSQVIIPVITHHQKLPTKKKRQLSQRISRVIQLILVGIPLVVSFFVPPLQTITSQIIVTLAIWLASFSTICFMLSWLLQPKATSRTRLRASRE